MLVNCVRNNFRTNPINRIHLKLERTAASKWGTLPSQNVRIALPESYEHFFIRSMYCYWLSLDAHEPGKRSYRTTVLKEDRRNLFAENGALSHYFYADLAEQFDAIIHFDDTLAVEH